MQESSRSARKDVTATLRWTREDVARAVESLGAVTMDTAPPAPARRQPSPALRHARRCYGHLAGECGVALWDRCCELRLIEPDADGWRLSAAGAERLGRFGIERDGKDAARVQTCLDWTERRWHVGGALGRALLAGLQSDGVLAPSPREGRTLLVHPARWQRWVAELDPAAPPIGGGTARPTRPVDASDASGESRTLED